MNITILTHWNSLQDTTFNIYIDADAKQWHIVRIFAAFISYPTYPVLEEVGIQIFIESVIKLDIGFVPFDLLNKKDIMLNHKQSIVQNMPHYQMDADWQKYPSMQTSLCEKKNQINVAMIVCVCESGIQANTIIVIDFMIQVLMAALNSFNKNAQEVYRIFYRRQKTYVLPHNWKVFWDLVPVSL